MIKVYTIKNQAIMKCVSFLEIGKEKVKPDFFFETEGVVKLFLIFFLSFFVSLQVKSQTTVSLGTDLAICQGTKLKLSDLSPVITGPTTSRWWSSSGDGTFSPSYTYPSALNYTPGSTDIANGFFTITLTARNGEPAGPIYTDQVKVFIQGDELFACNDNVIIPLNLYCEFKVTAPMLLEGENETEPFNLYDIEIFDADGDPITNDILKKEHVGQLLSYTVTHECSWNACSGTILVKDNYHPVTTCKTDTVICKDSTDPEHIGFPINTSVFDIDTLYKSGNKKYTVKGWDYCSDVTLTYTDSVVTYDCSEHSIFQELIVRYWKAVDGSNNTSRCRDTIRVKVIGLDSVILPPCWNNVDTTALECDGDWLLTALPNGNPSPEYTGEPEVWSCTQFNYTFTDTKFHGCGNSFDISREWTIIDWCAPDTCPNKIKSFIQIIKVMDKTPPIIECISDTILIGADPYECSSQKFELPIPNIYDNCSSVVTFINVFNAVTNVEQPVQKIGTKFYIQKLPLKLYKVVITAVDKCNNKSTCIYFVKAHDDKNPYVVCDQHTKVSIGSNGVARLNAESVDDGSFDNCGIKDMLIKKMTDGCGNPQYLNFGPYVDFCCLEANQTLKVVMKVTDISGNSNTCMVDVEVEDKLPPQIICPPDITISCNFYWDPNNLDKYFGKVVKDENQRKDIIIHDYYNDGIVGKDGYTFDNCNVTVTSTVQNLMNNCGVGKMIRTFTSKDDGGRTNQCSQTITIVNPEPFNFYGNDIIWPKDTSFYGCSNLQADTSITGAPIVLDNMCSMVAIRYDDQLFSVQNGACSKIVRKWTIRDWCQSDNYVWTWEQYIMLYNQIAPTFTSSCEKREICVYGDCEGLVELDASATDDCTPPESLVWGWKLDLDKNGTFDIFGQGNHFSRTMKQGTYTISWVVEDKCGNKNVCTYDFVVKDCKKPTPLCISDLTTVVMNQAGMVTVKAKSFNRGSYDNCTKSNYGTCGCLTDLKFSFSQNLNDTIFTITCADIPGGVSKTFTLQMWVTDEAGNQDYCTVVLQVQDNNGVCPDGLTPTVSGLTSKWSDNSPVAGINLKLQQINAEYSKNTSTQANGKYNFDNLGEGASYSIKPLDNASTCMAGVSTADLVKIQKHILGVKKFDTPFNYIAADANNSQSISAADILEIRKLILGISQTLPNDRCWVYVDSKQIPDIMNPYNFSDKIQYNNLNGSKSDGNFKVVKMGDVNDSYLTVNGMAPRNTESVDVYMVNTELTKGMEYDIPVYVNHENGIEGIQFTIKYNPENLIFSGYENSQIDPVESNFGYQSMNNGYITFSWNTFSDKRFDSNTPAFYLKFRALNNSVTYGNLMINSDLTTALSVIDEEEVPLTFRFENNATNELVVYQNNPNPFTDETTITFNMPQDGAAELKVIDATGKLLFTQNQKYSKGLNHITLQKSDMNSRGVLYYSIKVENDIITKKMILID
jgi:hypothetical protein